MKPLLAVFTVPQSEQEPDWLYAKSLKLSPFTSIALFHTNRTYSELAKLDPVVHTVCMNYKRGH